MPDNTPSAPPGTGETKRFSVVTELMGGATGAGIVLVLLPCIGLFFGMRPAGTPPATVGGDAPAQPPADDAAQSTSPNTAQPTAGSPTDPCYDVQIVRAVGQEAVDVAKQLLILVGTLVTSVTSFYFATQSTVAAVKSAGKPSGTGTQADPAAPAGRGGDAGNAADTGQLAEPAIAATATAAAAPPSQDATHDEHEDGCDVPITDPTDDLALPPTKGGVAP